MTVNGAVDAIQTIIATRQTLREARRTYAAAVKRALDEGVPETTIADALLRDSIAHDEVDVLLNIRRPELDVDERIPGDRWP